MSKVHSCILTQYRYNFKHSIVAEKISLLSSDDPEVPLMDW